MAGLASTLLRAGVAESVPRLSPHIKAPPLTDLSGENAHTARSARVKVHRAGRLVGTAVGPPVFPRPGTRAPPHARSSRTRGTLRPEVSPRRGCHPLGPLKAQIASFLMWLPLWRELPRTEAPSPRHLVARAGFPSPLRTPPPTPAVTSRPRAGKASLGFRTRQAKTRRGKINTHHRQTAAASPWP